MSRKAANGEGEHTERQVTNGPKPADYQAFVDRYEYVQSEIDDIDARVKEEKLPFKNDMKAILDEAEEIGIDKKALKAVISKRRKLKRAQAAYDKLDMMSKASAETIEVALGPFLNTPLGQAAAAAQ